LRHRSLTRWSADGRAVKTGIWRRLRNIGCRSCIAKDTWPFAKSTAAELLEVLRWAATTCGHELAGVTISGGGPFDQPAALRRLLEGLRHRLGALDKSDGRSRAILCYSGNPLRRVERDHADSLARLDVLIPEPYVESKPAVHLRGLANQRLVMRSPVALARYKDAATAPTLKRLQLHVDSDRRTPAATQTPPVMATSKSPSSG
jgi:anaerobic ribonucleoside-triphosphate reductase activating protein